MHIALAIILGTIGLICLFAAGVFAAASSLPHYGRGKDETYVCVALAVAAGLVGTTFIVVAGRLI